MIQFETIKFIKMLDELAKKSVLGFKPFVECNSDDVNELIAYSDDGKIILQSVIDEIHHDIVDCYEDTEDYSIGVVSDDEGGKYVQIQFFKEHDIIVISDGEWNII